MPSTARRAVVAAALAALLPAGFPLGAGGADIPPGAPPAASVPAASDSTRAAPAGPVAAASDSTPATPTDHPAGVFHIRPAAGPITIDGNLDDPGWQHALEITEFYDVSPGDNDPPQVPTRCRVAYDRGHFYFMARCYDPEPARIRAHVTDRDGVFNDDCIGVIIDTFHDHRTGYEFFVSPLGIQGDLSRNGDSEDASFDCRWESAARIDSLGWTAEFVIPTHSIRFPALDRQCWGLTIVRIRPRESRSQFSSNRIERGNPCMMCQAPLLNSFHGLAAGRNLELLPYATMTATSTRYALDAPRSAENDREVGLSAKYGITPSITLDATLHPDFAQVEADENQVSVNSQSALFFSEKRPFFLEGSPIFQTIQGQFYYSRNVADPRWAVKLTGREGRLQLGALAARDRTTQVIHPTRDGSEVLDLGLPSTDAVVRGKLGLLEDSYLGFTGTARSYEGGHNVLGALDGVLRVGGLSWTSYLARTGTRDLPGLADDGDSTGAARSGWATFQDLFYNSRIYKGGFRYTEKSRRYRADLGYQTLNDYRAWEGQHELDFQPNGRVVESVQPLLYLQYQQDHDGRLREQNVNPMVTFQFKGRYFAYCESGIHFTRYHNPYIDREIATHRTAYAAEAGRGGNGLITWDLFTLWGGVIFQRNAVLANARQVAATLNFRPGSRFTADLTGQIYRLRDPDVDTLLVRQSLGLARLTYQFTPRLFVRLLSQLQRIERPWRIPEQRVYHELANQLLLSYKLNYASVFFLGLNSNHDDGLEEGDGSVPPVRGAPFLQTGRQMFVKFQYLWKA